MIATLINLLTPYGVTTELELLHTLAYVMIVMGLFAFIALLFVPAPYGKYADKAEWFYGFPINGKVAWIVQECPSFLFVLYYWYTAVTNNTSTPITIQNQLTTISPRSILLTMYLFHYFNRSFIYPMLIRGGKDTPIVVMLMALGFCIWNG